MAAFKRLLHKAFPSSLLVISMPWMAVASPPAVLPSSLGAAGIHCAMASMDLAMPWLWFKTVLWLEDHSPCNSFSCSLKTAHVAFLTLLCRAGNMTAPAVARFCGGSPDGAWETLSVQVMNRLEPFLASECLCTVLRSPTPSLRANRRQFACWRPRTRPQWPMA